MVGRGPRCKLASVANNAQEERVNMANGMPTTSEVSYVGWGGKRISRHATFDLKWAMRREGVKFVDGVAVVEQGKALTP